MAPYARCGFTRVGVYREQGLLGGRWRAIAAALIAEGAHTVISSRSARDVERTVADLGTSGPGTGAGLACDVRDHGQVRGLVAFTVERLGGLDILVNNAGIGGHGNVADLNPATWRAVIDTNLTGVFYCCREAIPHLRARGGGNIINVSSPAGINTFPGAAAYNASKFGLNGFSEALFQEVRSLTSRLEIRPAQPKKR